MKISVLTLSVVLGIAGMSSESKAQITIDGIAETFCGMFSGELADACMEGVQDGVQQELGYEMRGEVASYEDLIRYCDSISSNSLTQSCRQIISSNLPISKEGLRTCSGISSDTLMVDCIGSIQGLYIQREAAQVCQGVDSDTQTVLCLKSSANKEYVTAETNSCAGEFSDVGTVNCMRQYGRAVRSNIDMNTRYNDGFRNRYNNGNRNQNSRRDRNRDNMRPAVQDLCRVVNSNNALVTNDLLTAEQFGRFVTNFAIENRSCVVGNIKGMTASRVLVAPNGQPLSDGLTEEAVNRLKKQYGYSRCRVLTCELN